MFRGEDQPTSEQLKTDLCPERGKEVQGDKGNIEGSAKTPGMRKRHEVDFWVARPRKSEGI